MLVLKIMEYYKRYYDNYAIGKKITREEALETLLSTYRDCDMTRDMLTVPNRIKTPYCDIYVIGNGLTVMAGLYNVVPDGVKYDKDGNRIE